MTLGMGRSLGNLLSILISLLPACLGYPWLLGCYHDDGWKTAPSASIDATTARGRCLERCQDAGSKYAVTDWIGGCRCVRSDDGFSFPLQDLNEDCDVSPDDLGCQGDGIPGGERNGQSVYLLDGPRLKIVNVTAQPETVYAGDSLTVRVDVSVSSSEIAGGWPNGTRARLTVMWILANRCDRVNTAELTTIDTTVSFVWVRRFYAHGTRILRVSVSSGGGVVTSHCRLTVLPPIPSGLQVTLDPEVRDTPTCVPSHLPAGHVTACTRNEVRLIASLNVGLNLTYVWSVNDKLVDITLPISNCTGLECRRSSLVHFFSSEGVSKVAVNVSNSHGWAHQLVHVVAINCRLTDVRITIPDGSRIVINSPVTFVITAYTTRYVDSRIHVNFGDDTYFNHSLQSASHEDVIATYDDKCNLVAEIQHVYNHEGDYVANATISDAWTAIAAHATLKVCNVLEQGVIIGDEHAAVHSPAELVVHLRTPTSCPLRVTWRVYNSTGSLLQSRRTYALRWHARFRNPGSHRAEATVENAISSISLERTILVQEPIRGLSVEESTPLCQTGKPYQISITYVAGTDVSCRWSTGQMSARHVLKSPNGCATTWVFRKPKTVVLDAVVGNLVSRKELSHVLNAVEPLHGLYVLAPKRVPSGDIVNATVRLLKGSHFDVSASDGVVTKTSKKTYALTKLMSVPGTMKFTVNLTNSVSHLTRSVEVEVVRRLEDPPLFKQLQEGDDSRIYAVDDLSTETLLYSWKLSDGSSLYTSVPAVEVTSRQNTVVSLLVSNDVSSVSAHAQNQDESNPDTPRVVHSVVVTAETEIDFTLQDIPVEANYNKVTVTYAIKRGLETVFQTYVKAISSSPSSYERWSHYFSEPSVVFINVTLSSEKDDLILSSCLTVQRPLADLQVEGPNLVPCLPGLPLVYDWHVHALPESSIGVVYAWEHDGNWKITAERKVSTSLVCSKSHTLKFKAWNGLSQVETSFTVRTVLLISEVDVTVSTSVEGKPSSIHISYKGTPVVNVSASFGDGTREIFKTRKSLSADAFDITLEHQYSSKGHYDVNVNVSNEVSWMTAQNVADVGEPITGTMLTLMSPATVALLESVMVEATVATGTELIFNWDFGDDNGNQYTSVESTEKSSVARHSYGIAKTYNISVSISNRYHDKPVTVYLSTPVQAVERISQLRLYTVGDICAAPLLKDPHRDHQSSSEEELMSTPTVLFEAQVYWGSDVEFLFDFGDGTKAVVPSQLDMLSLRATARCGHVYNREGVYVVKVTARNPLGATDVSLDHPFYVQIPPTGLKFNETYYITLLGRPVILKTIISSGTNVSYDWCVGDSECHKDVGSTIILNFDKTGKYNITVQAYNQVTDLSQYMDRLIASTDVYVQEPLQAVEICVVLKDGTICEGNEVDLPLDEKVVLIANALPTTEAAFKFVWNLGYLERTTSSHSYRHHYREPGVYAVNVTAKNYVSNVSSGIIVVHLVQRIQNLTSIHYPQPVLVNHTTSFHARYWFGTNLIFQWDFGDGTENATIHAPNIQHTYERSGEYWLSLHVYNQFSSAMIKTNIFALEEHCEKPEVKFIDQTLKRKIENYQDLLIEVDVTTSCDLTSNVIYKWKVLKIEESSQEAREIDFLPSEILRQQQLIIPKYSLPLGSYIIKLKVQMEGTIVYVAKETEINIIPSKLIAFWKGGIWRNIGVKNNVSLSIMTNINSTELSIHWYCSSVPSSHHSCFKSRESHGTIDDILDPHISFHAEEFNPDLPSIRFNLNVVHRGEVQVSVKDDHSSLILEISEEAHLLPITIQSVNHLHSNVRQDEKVVFLATCNGCQDIQLEFDWKLWLVEDGNHDLYISRYNCVQADGSTFFIHADNSSLNPTNDSGHFTSELPYLPTEEEESLEDELYPFPPSLGFSQNNSHTNHSYSILKKAYKKREINEDIHEILNPEETPTTLPLFPYPPVEGDVVYEDSYPRGSDNLQTPISEQDYFSSFPQHGPHDNVDEGLPGEAGSASERDQAVFHNLEEGKILEETGNGRAVIAGGGQSNRQKFPDPHNAGDPVKDSQYESIAPHLALRPRVPYPLQPYPVSPEYFVIEPGSLQIGGTFIVEVTAKGKDGSFGKAMDYVVVNMGPTNGRCTLMPLEGKELETWFRLHCMEWKSHDIPLSYELRYSLMPNVSGHLIYSGFNGNSKFTLPAGLPQNNYFVYVDVIVRDSSGSGTKVCSIVREVFPKWHNLVDMELYINNEVTDSLSLFNKMIGEQNWQAVLHQVHVWGRGLGSFVNMASRERRKRDLSINNLRERLLHLINSLKILNMVEAHQAISAVLALLEIPSELASAELITSFQIVKKFLDKKLYSVIPLDGFHEGIVRVMSHIITSAAEKMLAAETSEFAKLKSLVEKCKVVISDILKGKLMELLPNEKPFTLETPDFSTLTGYLANSNPQQALTFGETQIVISHQVYLDIFNATDPHLCRKNFAYSCDCVIVTAESFSRSPYVSEVVWSPHGSSRLQINGGVSSVAFSSCDRHEPIELPHPEIEFQLNRQQMGPKKHHTLNYEDVHFHQLNLTMEQVNHALMVSIHVINLEDQNCFPLMLLFSFNLPPHPNNCMKKEIFESEDKVIKLFIPADLVKENGLYYLAILDAEYINHSQNSDDLSPINYTLSVSLEQCLVWNQRDEVWAPEGCSVSEMSEVDSIHCKCQTLGPIGYSSQVLSTELEIVSVDRYLGTAMNLLPVIIIFLIYLISLILYHYFGANDSKKMPLVVLKDNNHKQGYLIIIKTGSYWDAGTTAMVCIILHGENGMSETIPLFSSRDSSISFFQRSSINTFYVSTQSSLGHLWKIQVWHNNNGSSPSWYLKNISVFDMNTGKPYCFECEQWLSVEEEDGQIEKEIPLNETSYSFIRIFQENFLSYLTDYHIWNSIYSKPSYSSFTRVQRITCCFSLTMMSSAVIAVCYKYGYSQHYFDYNMLSTSWQTILIGAVSGVLTMLSHQFLSFLFRSSNLPQTTLLSYFHPVFSGWSWKAIYCNYQQKDANSTVNSAEPFSSVNSGSVYSSDSLSHYDDSVEYADDGSEGYTDGENFDILINNNLDGLDTFIKNQYGYYSSWENYGGIPAESEFSDMNKKKDLLSEQLKSDSLRTNATMADIKMQDINRSDQTSSGFEDWQEKAVTDSTDIDEYLNSVPRVLFKKLYHWKFPSWVQSMTWFLLLTSAGISMYITIIYVYRFGSQYFSWWLQSLFYCVLSSIFLLHPLLVGILALFSSIKSWSPSDVSTYILSRFDTSVLEELSRIDYQFKMSEESPETEDEKLMKRQRARYLRYLRPPPESTLIQARIKALKMKHVIFAIKGISASVIMFTLLLIMTYGRDVNHNFYQKASIEKAFMRTARFPALSIKSHSDWWNWIRYDFLDGFYGTQVNDNKFLEDPNAAVLFSTGSISTGVPVIHSFFPTSQPCSEFNRLIYSSECSTDFGPKNKTMDASHNYRFFQGKLGYYSSIRKPVFLKTSREESYKQLDIVYNRHWVGNETRAVTVDFLLYNPAIATFISVSICAEFPFIGGAIVSFSILPSKLHQYNTYCGNLMMAVQFIFQILVFWTLKKELWKMWKMGRSYWSSPWRLLQMSFCSLSIIYSACSVVRNVLVTSSYHKYEQSSHEFYCFVRDVGEWDQVLNGQLGVLIFLHMIGWLEFLHTSSRIGQFLRAFSFVQKDIITLLGIFFILMLGFAHVGNLAFGNTEFLMKNPILQSLQVIRDILTQSPGNKSLGTISIASELYAAALFFGIFSIIMLGVAMMKAIIIRSKRHIQPKKEVGVGIREMMQLLQEKLDHSFGLSKKRDSHHKEISIPPAELLLMELESLVDEVFIYANKLFTSDDSTDGIAAENKDEKEQNYGRNPSENQFGEWSNSHQVIAELHYCSSASISCGDEVVNTDNEETTTEQENELSSLTTCDNISV